jgi:hypothetical protein
VAWVREVMQPSYWRTRANASSASEAWIESSVDDWTIGDRLVHVNGW